MLEALLISNIVLWIMVVVLAAVVLALARQIGVLHERVTPAGALVGRELPRIGEPAPRVALIDWSGRPCTVGEADPGGMSTLLVFVSPTCPVCKTLLPILDSVLQQEKGWLRLVLASDGAREEHEAFVRQYALADRTYVLSTELGLRYQAGKLPYAALIGPDGLLRAKGLVNTREHVESLFEAMERGVGSIQEYIRREAEKRRAGAEGVWSAPPRDGEIVQ